MARTVNGHDRNDPKHNKSLAIRTVLKKTPDAKAADVAATVKHQYGHTVSTNMVYMVKTKMNVKKGSSSVGTKGKMATPMHSPAAWVESIKQARALIRTTGSVANATALLNALGD